MKIVNVKTLSGYQGEIEKVCAEWAAYTSTVQPWYRGHKNISWKLIPSLYRGIVNRKLEREINRDFRLKASEHLSRAPESELEWLFIMQHHGVPTRLLDWTENPLAALYFAVEDEGSDADSCVWIMSPWTLNQHTLKIRSIPSAQDALLKSYALDIYSGNEGPKALQPAAVRPSYSSRRIVAQQGVFTLHGQMEVPLESFAKLIEPSTFDEMDTFVQIEIPREARSALKRQLFLNGMMRSALFPDLDGLAQSISYRYSHEYFSSKSAIHKVPPPSASGELSLDQAARGTEAAQAAVAGNNLDGNPDFTRSDFPFLPLEAYLPRRSIRLLRAGEVVEPTLFPSQAQASAATEMMPELSYGTVCQLEIEGADDSRWVATGFVVTSQVVITGAHTLYMHARKGFAKLVTLSLESGGSSRPLGQAKASNLRVANQWKDNQRIDRALGAILLATPLENIAAFDLEVMTDNALIGAAVGIIWQQNNRSMMTGGRINNVSEKGLYHNVDTVVGMSGSPVVAYMGLTGRPCVVGIHVAGGGKDPRAVRIDQEVMEIIQGWSVEAEKQISVPKEPE